MSVRVTQGLLYSSSVYGMNKSLSAYMESQLQSSSMKKLNRPSDDPAGAGRVISYRSKLNTLDRYSKNIEQATGWLGTADSVLGSGTGSIQTILSAIQTLALDMSGSDVTEASRHETSVAVREYYEQLMNLANSTFEGHHIFAGHKIDSPPYVAALGVDIVDTKGGAGSVNDDDLFCEVQGGAAKSIIIRATGPGAPGSSIAAGSAEYQYSEDGGATWHNAVVTQNEASGLNEATPTFPRCSIQAGGVKLFLSDQTKTVTVSDMDNPQSGDNGTWFYIRPTAQYKGDDTDLQTSIRYSPAGSTSIGANAKGYFTNDVTVRLDSIDNVSGVLTYSYSLDEGNNWTQTSAPIPTTVNAANPMGIPVPGGYLYLDAKPQDPVDAGMEFLIHPHRADINFQISPTDYITANMIGKDIFGGLYNYPADGRTYAVPVTDPSVNMFEVVGKLVGAMETNWEEGVEESLADLTKVMSLVLSKAAMAGGREDRLIATSAALEQQIYSEEENLSMVEDVDITELMTRLAQQQVAYNSVLKSSSMIMQMSLVNFL